MICGLSVRSDGGAYFLRMRLTPPSIPSGATNKSRLTAAAPGGILAANPHPLLDIEGGAIVAIGAGVLVEDSAVTTTIIGV